MAAVPEEKVNVQLARLGGSKETFIVDLYWTVDDLLNTISTRFEVPKDNLKLLCKGKMLNHKIANKTLKCLKIKKNDKIILMNKKVIIKNKNKPKNNHNHNTNTNHNNPPHAAPQNNIDDALKRKKNLSEIKAAAEKLAQRDNDGYDWNANYYIELTNQNGDKIRLPEHQRQALTVGLTLHEKGKKFMKAAHYKDAIYIMNLAFESLGKVDSSFLQSVDNYGLLALDIVWCHYLDGDQTQLSHAGQWLQIAEIGLRRAHGKNLSRLKQIRCQQNMSAVTGDFIPELSLYVRLNLLRALQCFYVDDIGTAGTHLMKAEMDMRKLQISDIDLVKLQSMGFHHNESRRALRFCAGNMDAAITHIYNKRQERQRKNAAEAQRRSDRALQRKYGATQNGKFVDLKLLAQLQGMGVEKEIAIEALRQTNNSGEETLNLCLDAVRKEVLTQTLYARHFNDVHLYSVEEVWSVLGVANVRESRVRAALFLTFNSVEESVAMLSGPGAEEVVDLDRVEARFVPYVQERRERLLLAEKQREDEAKMQVDNGDVDNVDNVDNGDVHGDAMAVVDGDDDLKKDEKGNVVAPVSIEAKAMPNPDLGDVNSENDCDGDAVMGKLVEDYKPIQRVSPTDDDMKIEQHLLDDLDNDDEGYLDIDLSKEQDALAHLKVLLASMQTDGTQQNHESFLSLFKK